MNIFLNRDIKRLFLTLCGVLTLFIAVSQAYFFISYGVFDMSFLMLSLILSAAVLLGCFSYFRKQNYALLDAVSKIERFTGGDAKARIESDREGSLYKLFHAINTLATTLNAHATKEQNAKIFLKDTISDISHQLKTPLAALAIYNSILQDESGYKTAVVEFTKKSEKEIDRIDMLVQSLLKITRLDARSISMDKHAENIGEMMNDIKSYFETRAKREGKEILLSGPDEAFLLCDRGWLIEAVGNIVKNALDHTGGGRVKIEWKNMPALTQIVISDDGCGIHPEDIHHIFKRFYRSRFSSQSQSQSIGLGLPLAKAIIEAHDGNIAADSVLGRGSTFVLSFLNLTGL